MPEREGVALTGSPDPIEGRCGAKLQFSDPARYCQRWPMRGKTRCKLHGGASLSGIAHPRFTHGMYSTVLKGALGSHYESARANPALVDLTEQIALVDAKTFELIEQLATGEGPAAWKRGLESALECQGALEAFRAAQRLPAGPARGPALVAAAQALEQSIATHLDIMRKGASDAETWPFVTEQIYLRKKLVDSEVKRRKAASEVMLKGQVLTLMGAIAASIHKHVTDPRVKQNVVNDIRLLISNGGSNAA